MSREPTGGSVEGSFILVARSAGPVGARVWFPNAEDVDIPQRTKTAATIRRFVLFTLVSLIGLCGSTALVFGETPTKSPSADSWETLLTEARAEGRQCGGDSYTAGPPLTWNDRLGAAAQAHSEDMADTGQLSHEGSDGETLADRLDAAGYEARAWGENVAAGQPDAAAVVAAWLDSPGHCANIMSADYTAFGAGVHEDSGGTRYWTLVLAAPRHQ